MRTSFLALAISGLATASTAQSPEPLSAIDWLSDSVSRPAEAPPAPEQRTAVAESALPGQVTVRPLDGLSSASVGLYPAARVGLPDDLWAQSDTAALVGRLAIERPPSLPVAQRLLRQLIEVRASPPADADGSNAFFLARVDALLAMGAVDAARQLLDLSDRDAPDTFRRWFDLSLLTGRENLACARMRALPDITPTYPARIFCLARGGDWMTAALTLDTAQALEVISAAETERLGRFLDDHAGGALLPPPTRPTPLDFALYEAVGEPLRTVSMPLAFSHADLRANTGWKSRIEAAERLARAGALDADRLWAIWAERAPAASGGLWDRVAAVQELEAAVASGDAAAIAEALPTAWNELHRARLVHLMARRYGARLKEFEIEGEAGDVALRLKLLFPDRSVLAEPAESRDPQGSFLLALSRGEPGQAQAPSDRAQAVADGFAAEAAPSKPRLALEEGRTGEAMLMAVTLLDDGAGGNLDAIRDGIATLLAAGLRDRAIAAGLELLILERRS